MARTCHRKCDRAFKSLIMLYVTLLVMISGLRLVDAQDVDTTQHPPKGKRALEVEISDQGVVVRDSEDEKKTKIGIVIDDEKITVDGKDIKVPDLDTALKAISLESGSIIKIGEPITVAEGEVVDGDLVSIGGAITVAGTVSGDVAVIGAPLHVKSTGIVRGDVITVGGTLQRDPGSQIRGQRVGALPFNFNFFRPHVFVVRPFTRFMGYGLPMIALVIMSLFLVALAAFFAPQNVTRIQETIEQAPLKSLLLGFAANIVFMPLFVLLCVTIIGIPVAFIIQPIAYFVASILGFAGVSLFVGTKIHRGSNLTLPTPMAKIIVGALAIELILILAWFLTLGGSVLLPLFWLFQLIGWIIIALASMAGLGAAAWTRFGRRSAIPAPAPTTQIPPTPPQEHGGHEESSTASG